MRIKIKFNEWKYGSEFPYLQFWCLHLIWIFFFVLSFFFFLLHKSLKELERSVKWKYCFRMISDKTKKPKYFKSVFFFVFFFLKKNHFRLFSLSNNFFFFFLKVCLFSVKLLNKTFSFGVLEAKIMNNKKQYLTSLISLPYMCI